MFNLHNKKQKMLQKSKQKLENAFMLCNKSQLSGQLDNALTGQFILWYFKAIRCINMCGFCFHAFKA